MLDLLEVKLVELSHGEYASATVMPAKKLWYTSICVCSRPCYVFLCVCEYGMSAMYVV